LAGPHAAMMLGDLGADIIKVETPKGGDDTRVWGPPFVTPRDAERESTYFLSANRNKRSIALDLKPDDGREALERMIERADVLLENFRTGVLDRLGFSPERIAEINPRTVVLSISGFGHDGPEGGRSGYDQIAQGEAGLMSFTGSGPDDVQRVGVPIADLLAGEVGAIGVIVALSIASTIVDVSPFSTNGALVLANAQDIDRDVFYKQILKYSALVVVIGPLIAWAVLVVPGWL
jgi:formyl-CoA transferase